MERIKIKPDRPPRDESAPKNRTPPKPPESEPDARARDDGGTGGTAPRVARPSANTKQGRMDAQIRESLTNLYGTIGLAVGGIGQMHNNPAMVAAGVNVTLQADSTVDTWLELGTQIPAVRRALESMLTGSAIATLAMCHVSMAAPVLAALGLIPMQMGGMFLADEARQAGEAFAAMRGAQEQAAAQNGRAG